MAGGSPATGSPGGFVEKSWRRIEAWCPSFLAGLLADPDDGADENEVRTVEAVFGGPLPENVRRSYLGTGTVR